MTNSDWPFVQRTHRVWRKQERGNHLEKARGSGYHRICRDDSFLFLCIIAIAAFGIYFSDWVTYQNLTRSLARDTVVAEISNNSRKPDFGDMQQKYYKLFNSMGSSVYYVKDATNDIQLSIVDADNKSNPKYAYGQLPDSDSGADQKANPPYSLEVAVKLTKNDTGKGFFANMKWVNIAFPDTMNITYFMYDENNPLNRAGN